MRSRWRFRISSWPAWLPAAGSWQRPAPIAARKLSGADRDFYTAKMQTARFYLEQLLPNALALARVVKSGGASVSECDPALI